MNTKNIFNRLALAMLMPAMLLTTACSNSNDDAIINNDQPAKKGFELPVTINVTRQGDDATTRATYDSENKKLAFSSGDQLFVWGYNSEGIFAGTLEWQSGGTFNGTITTQKEYSGTAETLLSQSDSYAVLLPNGYEPYGFFSITGDSYGSILEYDYTKAFADSKAAAVAQFSYEYAEGYSSGFDLSPKSAILNFTITGLTASTVNVVFTDGDEINFNKTVTTDKLGTATFAIGVQHYSYLDGFSLTVGGNAITLGSKILEAGHIYNITRSVASAATGHALTSAAVGEIVCSDGLAYYVDDKDNLPSGVTAVAKVCYVSDGHGLALALADESSTMNWNNAKTTAAAHTPAITGGTWKLASQDEWTNMINVAGFKALRDGFESVGGTNMQSNRYWSETGFSNASAYCYYFEDLGKWESEYKIDSFYVRACLAW